MNSGVTSLTAVMARTDLGGEAYVSKYGEEEYVQLVAAYSLYIGVASIAMAVLGFGVLAQKVPGAVKTGFKVSRPSMSRRPPCVSNMYRLKPHYQLMLNAQWGCELGVLSSALPNGLYAYGSTLKKMTANSAIGEVVVSVKNTVPSATGISGVANIAYAITHPQTWDVVSAVLFLSCAVFIMKAKAFLPKWMPPGSEVLIATAAATIYSIQYGYDGGIVGEIPTVESNSGLSLFGLVDIPIEIVDINKLLKVPIAERCFDGSTVKLFITAAIFSGVNFLSIVGIASGFETENAVRWSAPRELIAQGVSNLAAGESIYIGFHYSCLVYTYNTDILFA